MPAFSPAANTAGLGAAMPTGIRCAIFFEWLMSTEFLKKIQILHHCICNDIIGHSADVPNRNAAASQKIRRWICRMLILCFIRQKGFIKDEIHEIIAKACDPDCLNSFMDSEIHEPENDACADIQSILPQYSEELIQLLSQSTWTLDESTDNASAIHPGFLEKVFEILNERSNELGAYYTPPKIVRFMCRESLISALRTNITPQETESLRHFVESHDASCLTSQQIDMLKGRIRQITICDPAAGSGAFLIGMFHELLACQQALDPTADPPKLKKHIILHQIHGTDIDAEAIAIARWRLRLQLMTDEAAPHPRHDRDFRLFAGNALINGTDGVDFEQIRPGGFDIIIGNPPYGIKLTGSEREQYKKIYPCLKFRFDIYMVFFMLGLKLTRNTLCFITPDKWLSKSFAQDFRQNYMIPNMTGIMHLGNDIFDSALVDSVISIFNKKPSQTLSILSPNSEISCRIINEIDKSTIQPPFLIDQYFQSDIPAIIGQIESLPHRLGEYAHCEYACANPSAAYQLKPYIRNDQNPSANEFRNINTGLIDPFTHRWGKKDMRYLKSCYPYPVTDADSIRLVFGESWIERVRAPKIIIKGLNLLDCCIDLEGKLMPCVATLIVCSKSVELIMVLAAIINSSVIHEYIRAKYMSSSYCGGLLFTPAMINQIPVPDLSDLSAWQDVIEAVSSYLNYDIPDTNRLSIIDSFVSKHLGISE